MKKYLPYFLLALPFFLLKITNLGIWLSDTNIYFYTGYQLLQGKILYKDIFFTNFPLLPYISSVYFFLTNGNLPFYFFTASIEVICVGFLLYLLVLKKEKSRLLALLVSAIYLYSFLVLATSTHQTGVFIASLFALLSYYFYGKQRLLLSGIFIALAVLTKAYFLPVFVSLMIITILKDGKEKVKTKNKTITELTRGKFFKFFLGFFFATILVLLPSLLLAPHDLFRDVISYSLTRSQGIPKGNIAWFFLTHDTIFVLLLLWNIASINKRPFFGVLSLLSVLFFFLYQDIYYLYLNFCIPFLALSFPSLYRAITEKLHPQKMVLPTCICLYFCMNLFLYATQFRTQQKVFTLTQLTNVIQKEHPMALYGINSLTPALAYLTKTPLLEGIVDTNENIFRKGFLNSEELTRQAIAQHAVVVANAAIYEGTTINYPLLGGIFDEKAMAKSCKFLGSVKIQPEGIENAVTLFRC